jgi:uncharacterized protein (TIGR02271 family)
MTQKFAVHIEPREKGWAVVREGLGRASSVHPTQAEATKEGRDIARREGTEFFLHAQDGRIREHRSYGQESSATEKGGSDSETPDEEASDTEEVRSLTDAKRIDRSGTPEEQYAGFEVYGQDGERIGKLDALFVDENDQPDYVGVRKSPSTTRSALIPADIVTVDDRLRRMVVSRPKSVVEAGPNLGYDEEVTPELEQRVRSHYGLTIPHDTGERSGYGTYYRGDSTLADRESRGPGAAIPSDAVQDRENIAEPRFLEDEEELRVGRSEEELSVSTREHETGAVRVRKRVRTDRERIPVKKKRVEVSVERVPVEGQTDSTQGEAARPEIGEDEIVVPVIEEEVVVEKRPVVKEEIRIRKEVVEDTEIVEEDIRREEVEVDDET